MEVTHAATFRSKRRDEHCSSGIRNECNLLQANLTSRSPPRRKVAGRFHRGPQANPTCRIAETQPRTSDARPYIRFVTRSAWVRFGGRATTHRNCQLSTVNCQLSTIRMFATPLWDRLNCYLFFCFSAEILPFGRLFPLTVRGFCGIMSLYRENGGGSRCSRRTVGISVSV